MSVLFEQKKTGLTLEGDVILVTPGGLINHLRLSYVYLTDVSFFILDEAHRMLYMEFSDDVMPIEKYLPKERHTIMFSGTMPANKRQLA